MAVDDVSFYNLLGEEITRTGIVEQMIEYYALKLEAGETRVTDFNEGSEIRNLLEAFAVDLYMLLEEQNELTSIGFIDSAEGEWLDKHGALPWINVERDPGSEASGYVVFSIPEEISSDVVIDEGTIVVNDDGLEYATDGEGIISAGETSVTVGITCLTTGSDGNVSSGKITVIDDDYLDLSILSVNNTEAVTGGTDYEEDDAYRERLLEYIRQDDFGSTGYYTRLGSSVDGVHDVLLIDDENEEYTKIVLVNGDSKPVSSSIVADVLEVFSDPDNIVVGHSFSVEACATTTVNLTLNLTVQEEISESLILSTLRIYFDGGVNDELEFDGLYIDDAVTKDRIIDVLSYIDGINDITITSPANSTITPDENTVLKLGTVTINQTVEE